MQANTAEHERKRGVAAKQHEHEQSLRGRSHAPAEEPLQPAGSLAAKLQAVTDALEATPA